MNWIIYAVIANAMIFGLEYIYRSELFSDGFWPNVWALIVPILIAQWALFEMFRQAPSLVIAGATFTLINFVLRVPNSLFLGEKVSIFTFVAILLFVCGIVVAYIGR